MTPVRGVGSLWVILEVSMRPVHRSHVNKGRSARKFRKQTRFTKAPNMSVTPMRGGWRL